MTKRERQAAEYRQDRLPMIGGPCDGDWFYDGAISRICVAPFRGIWHYYNKENGRWIHGGPDKQGRSFSGKNLPHVTPKWLDYEGEDDLWDDDWDRDD